MTSSKIEPATFQFVAQCINKLHYIVSEGVYNTSTGILKDCDKVSAVIGATERDFISEEHFLKQMDISS
jgi:hypothetical protein